MNQAQIDFLVINAKMGDDKAFEQLFSLFQQSAVRYAFKILNDAQLAQEAAQNSWIKVAKNVAKLNDPRAFKSWLFQLIRWQSLDLLRKQKQLKESVSLEDIDEPATSHTFVQQQSELGAFIEQLEDIDKQAIHLFYLEEMSILEISNVLSVPVGTVKSRLNRARKTLKSKLLDTKQ